MEFISGKALDGPWWAGRLKTFWVGVSDGLQGRYALWAAPDIGFAEGFTPELSCPLHKWKTVSTEHKDYFSKAVWSSA